MKKGLIIQGPLMSKGRTGKTINIRFNQVTEADVVEYNCVENISRIVDEFSAVFDHVICVTWSTEPKHLISELQNRIGINNLLIVEDKTKDILPRGTVITDNNKYRQFYSMQKGLDYLEAKGCSVSVKVRSDQYSEYGSLALQAEQIYNKKAVIVPWFAYNKPDHLPDFYFAGSTKTLNQLCKIYLGAKEIDRLVHKDIFYRWVDCLNSKKVFSFFIIRKIKLLKSKFVKKAWSRYFVPASAKVIEEMEWRGERMRNISPHYIFCEHLEQKSIESYFSQ